MKSAKLGVTHLPNLRQEFCAYASTHTRALDVRRARTHALHNAHIRTLTHTREHRACHERVYFRQTEEYYSLFRFRMPVSICGFLHAFTYNIVLIYFYVYLYFSLSILLFLDPNQNTILSISTFWNWDTLSFINN